MFNDIRLLSTVSLKLNDCLPVVGLNTSSSVYSPRSRAGLGQEGPGCTGLVSGVVEVFSAFISSITSLLGAVGSVMLESISLAPSGLRGEICRTDFLALLGEDEPDLFLLVWRGGLPGGGDLRGVMSIGGRSATG